MISLDRTTTSSTLPSRRIAIRYSVEELSTQPEKLGPTRRRSSSSSSLSKRRAVLSMKELMPLALSPSYSPSSSLSLAEEQISDNVDGYFPEVLAKDLEVSNSVFASRNMTSGAPGAGLSTDVRGRFMGSPWPHRFVNSTYHGSSGPVHSLVPIQERNSVVSLLEHQYHNYDEMSTGPGSPSGTEISRDPVAPSINCREQSIVTAATSLRSSNWMPSPTDSPSCDHARGYSWIEPDSDEDEQDPSNSANEDNFTTLSPRPPTPPDSDKETEARVGDLEHSLTSRYSRKLHWKSHSLSGDTLPTSPATEPLGQRCSPKSRPCMGSSSVHRGRASSLKTLQGHLRRFPSSRSTANNHVSSLLSDRRPRTDPTHGDTDLLMMDEDRPVRHKKLTKNPVFIQPSPPPTPLPSVQSWLNESTSRYTSRLHGDDLTKAVPLPPDVVETLRVSIACFPETMLLTSSLTIETIRNYSRKVRHPSADMVNNLASDPAGESPRKSLWKRVVSYKQGPLSPSTGPKSNLKSPSTTSLEGPKSWAPLKNVFGCCSDYICDALWAHIVAYHYISALIPRSPRHPRAGSANDSQKDDIPKKAASLLGLAVSQDMGASVDHVARRFTSHLSWGLKDSMVTEQSTRSANYDNTTRDIQAGLMRCIMRLIATAKLMSENGTNEDGMVEMETGQVDVLFTRSLCEIVRMAEESH